MAVPELINELEDQLSVLKADKKRLLRSTTAATDQLAHRARLVALDMAIAYTEQEIRRISELKEDTGPDLKKTG